MRIAVFVATRWELQALRSAIPLDTTSMIGGIRCVTAERNGRLYCVIQTGVGPDRASKVARAALSEGTWALVLSTGFACALTSADVGDLIIGTEILSVFHDSQWIKRETIGSCSREEQIHLLSVGRETGITVKTGRVVSTARIAWRADEKRAIRDRTEAIGLDMESAALAIVARDMGIPMAIARTVSDLVDEDLPLDFNVFLRPTGWLAGLWALIRHPSRFIELNRLRIQSRVAAQHLAKFFKGYAEMSTDLRPATGEIR